MTRSSLVVLRLIFFLFLTVCKLLSIIICWKCNIFKGNLITLSTLTSLVEVVGCRSYSDIPSLGKRWENFHRSLQNLANRWIRLKPHLLLWSFKTAVMYIPLNISSVTKCSLAHHWNQRELSRNLSRIQEAHPKNIQTSSVYTSGNSDFEMLLLNEIITNRKKDKLKNKKYIHELV